MAQYQDSHHAVVNMDPTQPNPPAMVNMDVVQISLPTLANMDLPQVVVLVIANMDMPQVCLNTMSMVHVLHLSLDNVVLDLVIVLTLNNMDLIYVTHLALGHVVLDLVSVLVLSNMNHKEDVETSGNLEPILSINCHFAIRTTDKVAIIPKKNKQTAVEREVQAQDPKVSIVALHSMNMSNSKSIKNRNE